MSETGNGREQRRHKRIETDQPARARRTPDSEDIDINLKDVSAGGAAFDLEEDFDDSELLELEIDDVGVMSAEISRSTEDGLAVRFVDIDEQEEEMLLADLERLEISLQMEDY